MLLLPRLRTILTIPSLQGPDPFFSANGSESLNSRCTASATPAGQSPSDKATDINVHNAHVQSMLMQLGLNCIHLPRALVLPEMLLFFVKPCYQAPRASACPGRLLLDA